MAVETDPRITIAVNEPAHIGAARRAVLGLAGGAGFSERERAEIAIVVNELASNLIKHQTVCGLIRACLVEEPPRRGIRIESLDDGPGIADVSRAQRDGFSTAGSSGTGLAAVRRMTDAFRIESAISPNTAERGRGSVISCTKWRSDLTGPFAISVSVRSSPLPGETACGDGYVVDQSRHVTTVAVIDGLGHGPLAQNAAEAAAEAARADLCSSLQDILERAHLACRKTRGAAMTVARIDTRTGILSYVGIGNVRLRVLGGASPHTGLNSCGTLGKEFGRLRCSEKRWSPGSILFLYSDGLDQDLRHPEFRQLACEDADAICTRLFSALWQKTDDGTLLVAKDALR